jgi:hypothetical protein
MLFPTMFCFIFRLGIISIFDENFGYNWELDKKIEINIFKFGKTTKEN